jgi:hypothetical protein
MKIIKKNWYQEPKTMSFTELVFACHIILNKIVKN